MHHNLTRAPTRHPAGKRPLGNAGFTLLEILVVIAIPWRFVFDHYVRKQGDRWSAAQ